jgi:hypothetical protein
MNRDRLRAIYKYGAILSVVGIAAAIVAYAVRGPNSIIGLFFGWAGPLGAFFFGGAYLSETSVSRVVSEEVLRGFIWYFGSLVGWAFLISQTNVLSATPFAAFGLPALTAVGITLVMIGTRQVTGHELKIRTEGGQLLQMILGTIGGGFLVLYLVLTEFGWWLFALYVVSVPVGFALLRVMKKRYPDTFAVN